ncbi:PfkB family carbohydrate kinase [Sinorhizobium meliloti]|uniref:PfkB family carbohydrate kinase n=1 Tax=Rhizobium meliloti TaxID=382 RepID=UPI000B4A1B2D|nr:PfkB family carbohydrate kinase [Sinorhizobium meliloti]ASP93451.1 ribokinase [Sinorhizobium meliloti]MQX60559.1 ribokinase [Sinorhizobium meliloti]RVJ73425.1 ribokinase [Sinorhizobium meliloti]
MTIAAPSVVVFGSLHYDIIVKGPHRPRKGETVTGSAWYPKCGGKGGNQAVSAARYGVKSAMIGAVAEDSFGHALKLNLDAHGVDIRSVRTVAGEGSGMSVAIFDADGDYGAVIVSGSNLALSEEDVSTAAEMFRSDAVLVLQNEVPDAANVLAAQAMKKAGGRVVLNAAPARLPSADLVALVDVVVVNAVEAEALAEVPEVNSLDTALVAARMLGRHYPAAVVTAGGDGVAFVQDGGYEAKIPAIKVKLVSTHGAGDEFIGALAAELARGATLERAVNSGNEAAARLVSSPQA